MLHLSTFTWIRKYRLGILIVGVMTIALGVGWISNPCYGQEAKDLSSQDKSKSRLNRLKDGKEAMTAEDKALLEQAARFQLRRLAQDKYWRKQPPENKSLDDFVEETFKLIPMPASQKPLSDGQQQYLEAFASAYLGPIDEALHHREPIVKVNAARIL